MINRILEKLREEKIKAQKYRGEKLKENDYVKANVAHGRIQTLNDVEKIVQEVAKDGGWIPTENELPTKRDWYLALFKEPDTDFVLIPKVADYLMGVHTNYTTEEGWIIADCTDTETERDNYYKKLKCIAWKQIAPYQKAPSRCDTCTHNVADEVPPICYMCSKGIEDNYERKGE